MVSLPVTFQILPSVFEPDFVLLQKAVEFVARLESQQAAELRSGDLSFPVGFKGYGFEGGAGKVRAGGSQSSGKLVGKVESKLHASSIAEVEAER